METRHCISTDFSLFNCVSFPYTSLILESISAAFVYLSFYILPAHMKEDNDFIQSAFTSYRATIHEEMKVKWAEREQTLKEEFQAKNQQEVDIICQYVQYKACSIYIYILSLSVDT